MEYIIPIYVNNFSDKKEMGQKLKKFITDRIGYTGTFEVHESMTMHKILEKEYNKYPTKLCTVNLANCYPGAKFIGFDIDPKLDTYFVKIEADENFNTSGRFFPGCLVNNHKFIDRPIISIVRMDYVLLNDRKESK